MRALEFVVTRVQHSDLRKCGPGRDTIWTCRHNREVIGTEKALDALGVAMILNGEVAKLPDVVAQRSKDWIFSSFAIQLGKIVAVIKTPNPTSLLDVNHFCGHFRRSRAKMLLKKGRRVVVTPRLIQGVTPIGIAQCTVKRSNLSTFRVQCDIVLQEPKVAQRRFVRNNLHIVSLERREHGEKAEMGTNIEYSVALQDREVLRIYLLSPDLINSSPGLSVVRADKIGTADSYANRGSWPAQAAPVEEPQWPIAIGSPDLEANMQLPSKSTHH